MKKFSVCFSGILFILSLSAILFPASAQEQIDTAISSEQIISAQDTAETVPIQPEPSAPVLPLADQATAETLNQTSRKAASTDTAVVDTIGEIIVTASRTAIPLTKNTGAVTVISERAIKSMPRGIAADEALGLVPGVRIENQADGERLHMSIRGQGILSERGLRGITFLLDGLSFNDPTGFASDLYDVDWETVDRIEVLRGPAASLYGCASNAGVLNIITQCGGAKPTGGVGFGSFGSNGFWKTLGQLNGSRDNSSYRISYSRTQGYGSRIHQDFWGDNASMKEVWTPSSNITVMPIGIYSSYFNQNAEGLNDSLAHAAPEQANSDAIPFNEFIKTTKLTGGVVVKAAIAENHSIDVTGFLRSTSFKESNNRYFDERSILTPGASVQYNWIAKGQAFISRMTIGGDYKRQSVEDTWLPHANDPGRTEEKGESSEDVIIPKDSVLASQFINQSGIGVFLQEQVDINKLTLMGNLRYDNISNELTDLLRRPGSPSLSGNADFEKVTGRVGASYSLMKSMNFYANWGLGFLPPCTEELMVNPYSYGGFNKNLKASQSMGEELGIRGSVGKKAFYEVTGFLLNTENDFIRYRISSRPQETFYANAGDSKRLGAETSVSWSPVKTFCIQLAYTFSNFKYSSSPVSMDSLENLSLPEKDQWLPNSPQHQIDAQIDYRFLDNFIIEANTHYQSQWYIYTDSKNAKITEDRYALFNARLGYDWKFGALSGDLSFSVRNIADRLWIAFTEPDLDNGNPNNSYQPGPGREFFGGVRVKF